VEFVHRGELAAGQPIWGYRGPVLEQSPQACNRVTLDPTYTDGLGLPRPKISYGFDQYTLDGFAAARQTSSAVYKSINAIEFTDFSQAQSRPGYFEYDGVSYVFFGAGHVVGTHRMGTDRSLSVVDANQRSWDHQDLWIVSCGSFPTIATPNPTLTLPDSRTPLSRGPALDPLAAVALVPNSGESIRSHRS
jgi:glucose dehydrogenase